MSHEIRSNDRLVLVGQPAWHGLGTVVQNAPTVREALVLAGLDWEVESSPVFYERTIVGIDETGVPTSTVRRFAHDGSRVLLRSDDGTVLSVMGDGYSPVQNRDLADLIYEVAAKENVTVETAGSLKGGRVVFFLVPIGAFDLGGKDPVRQYGLFLNSHDGSRALTVLSTDVRVVCANTEAAAFSQAAAHGCMVALRHTQGIRDRMDDVRNALAGARVIAAESRERAETLSRRPMNRDETRAFFERVYTRLYGTAANTVKGGKAKDTRARDMIGDWLVNLESEIQTHGFDRSAWTVANAVTRWVDHSRTVRGGDRIASNLIGTAADAKSTVMAEALALATAS